MTNKETEEIRMLGVVMKMELSCYKLGFLEMFDHGSLKSQGLIRERSLRNLPESLDLEVVLKE